MKALVFREYGSLELGDVPEPPVGAGEARVRVRACSLNPMDWYFFMGRPYLGRLATGLRRPKQGRLGADFAGTIESVGAGVSRFRPGDDVFGACRGALAEFVSVPEGRIALKPSRLAFEEAAAVPVAALTALQALRRFGGVQLGQKVLINGAAGGVGTFAVQIAKSLGADVTGVCGANHVGLIRSLGADRVIDYTREDFTLDEASYDLMLDIAGSRSWSSCRRVLAPRAVFVIVGGSKANPFVGPMGHMLAVLLNSRLSRRRIVLCSTKFTSGDLVTLKEMLETGKIKPIIDRRYDLAGVSEALEYLGEGHAGGKLVVTL